MLRTVTFSPSSPDDVIVYVHAEGTLNSPASAVTFALTVSDAAGFVLGMAGEVLGPGAELPIRIRTTPAGVSSQPSEFPSPAYTASLTASIPVDSPLATLFDLRFKIVTLEGVVVSDPSPAVSE